jgi:MSHA pilin protein MshC
LIAKNPGISQCRGFSLIELIAVLVLIAILSVIAVPKIKSTSGYEEFIVRDQLISAIRYTQQHAMYDRAANHCYRINISAQNFVVQSSTNNGATFGTFNPDEMIGFNLATDKDVSKALERVTMSVMTQAFDGLGNPVANCGGANAGNQTINIVRGTTTLRVCILSTGYVRAC